MMGTKRITIWDDPKLGIRKEKVPFTIRPKGSSRRKRVSFIVRR